MGIYICDGIFVDVVKWTGGIDQKEDPEWLVKLFENGYADTMWVIENDNGSYTLVEPETDGSRFVLELYGHFYEPGIYLARSTTNSTMVKAMTEAQFLASCREVVQAQPITEDISEKVVARLKPYHRALLAEWVTNVEMKVMGVKTTICMITLHNGFEIVGTSACVNPADFDAVIGQACALEDALSDLDAFAGFYRQAVVE